MNCGFNILDSGIAYDFRVNENTNVKVFESTGTIYKLAIDENGTGDYTILNGWSTSQKQVIETVISEIEKSKKYQDQFKKVAINHIKHEKSVKKLIEQFLKIYNEIIDDEKEN